MKKFLLSALLIITFLIYVFSKRSSGANQTVAPLNSADNKTSVSSNTTANVSYKDGTYNGDLINAYYGNVQIQTIISGHKIINVQFLSYPNDRQHSAELNYQAMPILKTEAIQVQSANVDMVSGATLTSQAFQQSLQSALNQAQ